MAEMVTDENMAHLSKVVARLHRLLGPLAGWRVAYLRQMVLLLPEQARSFKSVRPVARPSEITRKLRQLQRNPRPLIEALTGPGVTRDKAWHEISTSGVAVILLYHYARANWGGRAECHLGPEGDALDHLRHCPNQVEAFRTASKKALKDFERQRPRGRGGSRNVRDTALQLASEHVLDVYVTITREWPSVSVLSKKKNPEVQIKGTSIAFLETCLSVMGLWTSRATLRRCIEAYRANLRRRGDPR